MTDDRILFLMQIVEFHQCDGVQATAWQMLHDAQPKFTIEQMAKFLIWKNNLRDRPPPYIII